jgi:hypothetical protein
VGCIFQIKIQFKLQGSARVLSGWGVTVDHVTIQSGCLSLLYRLELD